MFDLLRNRLSKTNIWWRVGVVVGVGVGCKMCEFCDRNFSVKKPFPKGFKLFQLANTELSKISIFW